ncbi:hypothetical protein PFLUV_G00265660 [Perca fluviatilis]|uniref:Uncharacterized protein n=1 Tax=Perca fluviatilis TaxID=8168 RepID=A0A6A5E8X3_PERFL|nr:hypothetical protein PFLUV_G00265660 [Perca fluviatilis]
MTRWIFFAFFSHPTKSCMTKRRMSAACRSENSRRAPPSYLPYAISTEVIRGEQRVQEKWESSGKETLKAEELSLYSKTDCSFALLL